MAVGTMLAQLMLRTDVVHFCVCVLIDGVSNGSTVYSHDVNRCHWLKRESETKTLQTALRNFSVCVRGEKKKKITAT